MQIAEIDATDETAPYVTKTYRWAPSEPVATRPLALSLWTREGAVRETLYYAHDLRKNVVSLFDAKGLRRASYQYDPYGNISSMEGDMAESNPFRYSSEHHDEDLGLVYYNYRHYNPTDGRWTSRDPIAEQGGYNLYGFLFNDPISFIDYLGFWQEEPANSGIWKAEVGNSLTQLTRRYGALDAEAPCIFPANELAAKNYPRIVENGLYNTKYIQESTEKNEVGFCVSREFDNIGDDVYGIHL